MTRKWHTIDFILDGSEQIEKVEFLPYGTRVLKVKVIIPQEMDEIYYLRTLHRPPKFGKNTFYTHEDGNDDFRISWGGGHEEGACVNAGEGLLPVEKCISLQRRENEKLPMERYLYLNMSHIKGSHQPSRQMLLAVYPKGKENGEPSFSKVVELSCPKVQDPVRLKKIDPGIFSFVGSAMPDYLGRWWADTIELDYMQVAFPNIRIEFEEGLIVVKCKPFGLPELWKDLARIECKLTVSDMGKTYYFDADLFRFGNKHIALRLWFFWLTDTAWNLFGREVPDAERFDIVFDANNGQTVYVATDTHWLESWVEVPRDITPVAKIGLFSKEFIKQILSKEEKENYDSYLDYLVGEHEIVGEKAPHRRVLERLEAESTPEDDEEFGTLGAGIEANVPYFVNLPPPHEDLVSSDPRKG
jgi:hypothetical protein